MSDVQGKCVGVHSPQKRRDPSCKGDNSTLATLADSKLMDVNANSKLKRKKKTHGPGNPSKRHRDRLNAELDNLARLLPFPEEIVTKLDKISILRLTVSYLRAKSFFQVSNGTHGQEETCEELVREVEGNGVFSQLSLEALDGFIAVITQEGQLFYVSENVRDFLGYSQAAVIHQSMFKFLHIDDQDMVKSNLAWPKPSGKKTKTQINDKDGGKLSPDSIKTGSDENDSLNRSFTCRMKCTLNHGGGFYKLFRLSGRLREIHTRKRDSQVLEYGLFAICSPANNPNSHHAGVNIKKEVALTAQKRLERSNSDPVCVRRTGLPLTGMLHSMPISRHFSMSETRSAAVSPLASPTTSTDSGHPSPDSSQGGKMLLTDSDVRSDGSEVSPPSSSNSQDVDVRPASERLLSGINNPFVNPHRMDRKRAAAFMDSMMAEDKDSTRKRSRSLADAELFLRDGIDHRSLFFRNNLTTVPEVKVENGKKKEECTQSSDVPGRRLLNNHDSRLDAAQGLVNLGNMASQFPGLCAFPPELMYPDVMFPRVDMLHDLQHLRNPFDIHNPYCLGSDPYTAALAMRRWLNNPEMFHSQLNPLLAAQSGLLSPAERLRFLKFPFGYPSPFPSPSPFDFGAAAAAAAAAAGLTERNLPEYAFRNLYQNGLVPDMAKSSALKETEQKQTSLSEKQVRGGSSSPPSKTPSKSATPDNSKKGEVEKGKEKKEESDLDEFFEEKKKSTKERNAAEEDEDEDEKVDVVGGVKPTSVLRQTFAGIQEEFNSRLENLNKSFARSLDQNMTCP